MFFNNPRRLLSEAATADLLSPEVSDEVKDVIEELEDDLYDQNIEEVKDGDMTTNGGIPVTTEAVNLMESAHGYGKAMYLVTLEQVIAIKETEGEAKAAEAMEEPGAAPSEEECEAAEPHAGDIIEDIASKNGVDPEQVAVVISAESVAYYAEMALLEAKAGRKGDKNKSAKKAKKASKTIKELFDSKIKMIKSKKK